MASADLQIGMVVGQGLEPRYLRAPADRSPDSLVGARAHLPGFHEKVEQIP